MENKPTQAMFVLALSKLNSEIGELLKGHGRELLINEEACAKQVSDELYLSFKDSISRADLMLRGIGTTHDEAMNGIVLFVAEALAEKIRKSMEG